MLAVAVHVARREGLPLPVPATLRYRDVPMAEESAWQELVIRHLALDDWTRLDVGDEHDYLGPVAQPVLRRHGVLWPPYLYSYQPLMKLAAGGVFMTGFDGDNLFAGWRWARLEPVRRRAVRPGPGDLGRLALIAGPPLGRRVAARRHRLPCTWLTPLALREVKARWFAHYAAEPVRWDGWVEWLASLRGLALEVSTIDVLARDCGATVAHPLLDRRFLAALARQGGRAGCGDRTAIMQSLLPTCCPPRSSPGRPKPSSATACGEVPASASPPPGTVAGPTPPWSTPAGSGRSGPSPSRHHRACPSCNRRGWPARPRLAGPRRGTTLVDNHLDGA